MTEETVAETKTGTKERPREEYVDTVVRVLKKDHNWKFFVGMIAGAILLAIL